MTTTLWLCCLWCCGFFAALSDIAGVGYSCVAAGGVAVEAASYVLDELTVMVLVVMALLVAVVVDIGGGCSD